MFKGIFPVRACVTRARARALARARARALARARARARALASCATLPKYQIHPRAISRAADAFCPLPAITLAGPLNKPLYDPRCAF